MTVGPTFASLLAEAFDQIRNSAKGNLTIMSRMLDALQTLAGMTASAPHRLALREQAQWIGELAERSLDFARDHAEIDMQLARFREGLEAEPASDMRDQR